MQMTVEHEMERNIDFQRRSHSGKPIYEKLGDRNKHNPCEG